MKKLIFTITIIGFLASSGCNDWLDVKPASEAKKEDVFSTQKGFKDALTGAYIRLKNYNAYGDAMTWGYVEYLAQHWYPRNSAYHVNYIRDYNYTHESVKGFFANIYQELYKAIADVNSILERIDEKNDIFTQGYYELIKGEALTIRAFCHFDLLRLFGPIPTEINDRKVLPYVKTVTKEIHDHLSYNKFIEEIEVDLNEAEKLLSQIDPILTYSINELNPGENDITLLDDYWYYRQVRMNYYSVLAIKARFYLWTQNKTNAGIYAKKVIEAKDINGNLTYRLGNASDIAVEDYTLSSEHIMALSVHDLKTKAENRFSFIRSNEDLMRFDASYYMNQLFPIEERTTDIRWMLWEDLPQDQNYKILKKFIQKDVNPILQLPLIRLSEMYLIASETAPNLSEANQYYETYCISKGIPLYTFNSENDITERMKTEYNREFYAEGQGFFVYKRLNSTSILWANKNGSPEVYIVPLPDREIVYSND